MMFKLNDVKQSVKTILSVMLELFRQKQVENKTALALLPSRLQDLEIMDWQEKQVELALGKFVLVLQIICLHFIYFCAQYSYFYLFKFKYL